MSRALCIAVLVLLCGSTAGCRSCHQEREPSAAAIGSAIQPAALPMPSDALGEVIIPSPDRLWALWNADVAGTASNLELQLADVLGLPPLSAGQLNVKAPIRGLLVQEQDEPGLILAIALHSGAELTTSLVNGSQAPFAAQRLPTGETVLERKGAPAALQLAVLENCLLVSRGQGARPHPEANRYLSQAALSPPSMVAQPSVVQPSAGLPPNAGASNAEQLYAQITLNKLGLTRIVIEPLKKSWEQQRATWGKALNEQLAIQGRPADYADPERALAGVTQAMQELIELTGSLNQTVLRVSERQGWLKLSLQFDGEPGGSADRWFSSLRSPAQAPWPLLSSQTNLVFSHLSSSGQPSNGQPNDGQPSFAQRMSQWTSQLFAGHINATETQRIEQALSLLGQSTGEPYQWGWLGIEDDGALFWSSQVADPAAFQRGIEAVVALADIPALQRPSSPWFGELRSKPIRVPLPELGLEARGFELRVKAPAGQPATGSAVRAPSALLWAIKDGVGYVTVGSASQAALRELLAPAQRLNQLEALTPLLEPQKAPASFTLLFHKEEPKQGNSAALLSLARSPKGANLELRVNRGMVQSTRSWLHLLYGLP
jgi:hypothetical protein